MIHIEVDYYGERSIETYSFTSTGDEYQAKLNEIKSYPGKINGVKIYIGSNRTSMMWEEHPVRALVETTNTGIAVRKGRKIRYPSTQ